MSSTSNHDIQALIDHKVKTGITNGGRSLQAIKRSSLKLHEKCFLDSIGSRCDFRGDFLEPIPVSQKEIASDWSMSVRTVIRHALALEEQGYIICHGEKGKENSYSLTPKIFKEHEKRLRDNLNKRHGNKVENSLCQWGCDSQSQGGVTLSHRGADSESYQYSIPQSFPIYYQEPCPNNDPLIINDILNIDRYPSTRTLFEGLTDIQKEKVFLVLKENSSRYDYDSMSDNQLVELLKQVLAEGDSGNRPHVLNKELPIKRKKEEPRLSGGVATGDAIERVLDSSKGKLFFQNNGKLGQIMRSEIGNMIRAHGEATVIDYVKKTCHGRDAIRKNLNFGSRQLNWVSLCFTKDENELYQYDIQAMGAKNELWNYYLEGKNGKAKTSRKRRLDPIEVDQGSRLFCRNQ